MADTKKTALPVIGYDGGNFKTYLSFIPGIEEGTRMGGSPQDLIPVKKKEGIESIFFYSEKAGEIYGDAASRARAVPIQNRIRYLKRNIGKTFTLDGKTFTYEYAITQLIQYCMRLANEKLMQGWQISTNLISLAHPATFTRAQVERYIQLAEAATLADGKTHVKVNGTIAEPAAASLDYMEFNHISKEMTVMVYDLGGGTHDNAIVAAYPKGRKNTNGSTYYYDIVDCGGAGNVGGFDFDEALYKLILNKFEKEGVKLKPVHKDKIRDQVENIKIDLSSDPYAEAELLYEDEYRTVQVTVDEFEKATHSLLMKTITATKQMLKDHPNQKPEMILLTGGASQMPMVKKELEKEIPEYKGKIISFRPSRAISYGAARYGALEEGTDPNPVQKRTVYDIGVRYYKGEGDYTGYVETRIPAGTPLPCKSDYMKSYTVYQGQTASKFDVNEAKGPHPNRENQSDYNIIVSVTLEHDSKGVPKGTPSETRLVVNEKGVLEIEARDPNKPNHPPIRARKELKNLSA